MSVAPPSTQQASAASAEAVLRLVGALCSELRGASPPAGSIGLSSHLERDLGFDSLARVELVLRLERAFGVRLPDATAGSAETVADLLALIQAAAAAAPSESPAPIVAANLALAPREPLAEPETARTLIDVLEWHAQQHPDAVHAIVLDGETGRPLTYGELRAAARNVAGALQRNAMVKPGSTVALMLPTGVEYLQSFFGVLLAGAVPVPIYPPLRASQIEEHVHRYAQVLSNAGAETLITVPEARTVAHLLRARVPSLRHVCSVPELMQPERFEPPSSPPSADSIAMLQYTSGSTGLPKGVVLTHANLLANIRAIGKLIGANASDVFVSWLPLYHDMGLIGAWLGSLYFGCLLVLMPPTAFLKQPARWLQTIHRYRGTLTASPNFGYEFCARRVDEQDLGGLDLSSLRIAFNGAEPVNPDTLQRFATRLAPYGYRAAVMTPVYGLAEAAVGLTFPPTARAPVVDIIDRAQLTSLGRAVPVPAGTPHALRFVSCGRPLPGYRIRIIDETGAEVPERIEGMLQFTGPSATSGYYRNPDATARLLAGEWRDTGDRAYLAGGELYITGRTKDIVIRRGRHIYPDEIESAVGELNGVRKGCIVAFGSHDDRTASERLVVVAETAITDATLQADLRQRINERVVECIGEPPEDIVLAAPHAVLKTSSGKLRRAATRAAYEDGSLGRTPAGPVRQMLRLRVEAVRARLRATFNSGLWTAYGLYAWGVFCLIGVPAGLLIALQGNQARAWHLNHQAARWLVRAWRIPLSVTWETRPPLPVPHVLVVNHCSYMDSILLASLLPDPHIVVAKAELHRVPVMGRYLERLGIIFVDRSAPDQRLLEVQHMKHALAQGQSVIIFPEGTFTAVTGLRPFHLGAFEIAAATGTPLIALTLRGSRSVLRDGRWLPRRLPVAAVIGAPRAAPPGDDVFAQAVWLRDAARAEILRHCGEPDLQA